MQLPERDIQHILDHTQELWGELRGQQLFLTGGTGFFGKWLVASFNRASDEYSLAARLWVLTRDPLRALREAPVIYSHPNVRLHQGDVRNFEFPIGEFSHVIHAATESDPLTCPLPREQLYEANVAGTRRVLDFAKQAGARRLLNLSSGAVYGPQPLELERIGEDSSCAPDTGRVDLAYGHSKRASEFLVAAHAAQGHFEACSARCFTFVGPHLPLSINYAIGNFIRDALLARPIQVSGDGTPLRSYLYAADLAVWLWTLLLRGQAGRCYNIGSDSAISIFDLANLVSQIVNPAAGVTIARAPVPGQLPPRYVPSIERARSELSLKPWVELSDAIERTANWNRPLFP
jgi:dTDP-glucose 4,6-dehydratase